VLFLSVILHQFQNKVIKEGDMLVKFGAKNFSCFREGIEISFELGAKRPASISRGNYIANLICVKGANGSGKSNALKILAFLKEFCCNSFNNKPEKDIYIDSFFMNDDPIDIYCDFIFNRTKYRYELCLTPKGIISEKLSRKVKRLSTVFEREGNKLTYCIKEFGELNRIKFRTNSSIISTAHQYEIESTHPSYQFFNSIKTNFSWFGPSSFSKNQRAMSKYYHANPVVLKDTIEIIKECDLGITNIEILEDTDEDGKKFYFPIFHHDVDTKRKWLTFYSQSLGTQTLFTSIPYYIYSLKSGGVLVMDEFDTDFHPHILPKIVRFFDDKEINVKNSQMIFSTHNTDILEYMGKYRTVLINKESSESYGYRLDEISGDIIRNDRLIAPVYKSGKIGGIPRI